jgi:hypothetical protein
MPCLTFVGRRWKSFVMLTPGSGTPVRKISAHEFERGGLTKPLVTTIDGTPTFLSPPVTSEVSGQIRKKSRHDIQVRTGFGTGFKLVFFFSNRLKMSGDL